MTPDHTPHRPLRIPDEEWNALIAVVGERRGTQFVRAIIRWWLRWPGHPMPERPAKATYAPDSD